MYVMLEQYHSLKCEEQFFSSNIINLVYIGLTFNGTSLIVDLLLLSRGLLSPHHSKSESVLYLLHFQSYLVSIKTEK